MQPINTTVRRRQSSARGFAVETTTKLTKNNYLPAQIWHVLSALPQVANENVCVTFESEDTPIVLSVAYVILVLLRQHNSYGVN